MVDCASLLETVGIHVPVRNFRDFPLFAVGSSHKSCPSSRSASATNTICRDIDMYRYISLKLNKSNKRLQTPKLLQNMIK
jgi:hypothetical protein